MEEVQMSVMETWADKLLAVVDNRRSGRRGGNHVIGRTDCEDTVACDGNRQLAGGIDAVLRGKDVLGADNPIDMLHGHPHLWQEIQHPRVYSPALVTKPQAANGNFTSPSGRWHTGESLYDFAINPARSKSTMTKTKAQQIMAATEARAADDVTAASKISLPSLNPISSSSAGTSISTRS